LDQTTQSTKASLDSSTLLSNITSVWLGSCMWKGPTYSFVFHWQDKVHLYEKQVPTSDHFSAGQKCVMLQNAVHPIMELHSVKNQADQHKTQTGQVLTYQQYSNLLLSAASAYDAMYTPKESPFLCPKGCPYTIGWSGFLVMGTLDFIWYKRSLLYLSIGRLLISAVPLRICWANSVVPVSLKCRGVLVKRPYLLLARSAFNVVGELCLLRL